MVGNLDKCILILMLSIYDIKGFVQINILNKHDEHKTDRWL